MVITLIGYRASGKSSLAPMVAKKLGWSWIDSDREIERVAERSIPEIFAADGEAGFRELESQILVDLLQRPQLVIASGGGSVLSADNRQVMKPPVPLSGCTCLQESSSIDSTGIGKPGPSDQV